MHKSGFVAIIGRPNVGKSTLLNQILGQKVSITSDKPQTTRERIRGIYSDDDAQIVFVDTPGVHKPKNKLGAFMEKEIERGRSDCDLVLFLVEPDFKIGPGDRHIAETIKNIEVPVFLIINKTDRIDKDELLPVIDNFKDLIDFDEIFPVSAKTGEGVEPLVSEIIKRLPEGPFYYDEDDITDMPIRAMCAEIIREKALHLLDEELPHGIAVLIDEMKLNAKGDLYHIDATVVCEKKSHKSMIIGRQGAMLKKLGTLARVDMEDLCGKRINLKIWVKVKDRWRESDRLLKNFGYIEEN